MEEELFQQLFCIRNRTDLDIFMKSVHNQYILLLIMDRYKWLFNNSEFSLLPFKDKKRLRSKIKKAKERYFFNSKFREEYYILENKINNYIMLKKL